jgi:hypothetical protein
VFDHTERHAALLRDIAEQMAQQPVRLLADRPGVRAVYRVTVRYDDRRALDAVTTVTRDGAGAAFTVYYEGLHHLRPAAQPLPPERFTALAQAWQRAGFDRLHDQPGLPLRSLDLWLLERAAGTFVHSVIVAPQTAVDGWAALVEAVRQHLPQALREIV